MTFDEALAQLRGTGGYDGFSCLLAIAEEVQRLRVRIEPAVTFVWSVPPEGDTFVGSVDTEAP